ncbi:MAG: hypothetical protein A3E84_04560 [Gammaproteobacteria bacterium RIFCSPHIGHO2_12_FULL_42_13]|nr:MAG: hypothetical protein A3E84_04560 [Gammaproteobacteria bacterium RIFCSPHIGHO2_12_FULL_42_13]
MSILLWGKVYYQDKYAGILRQEPGDRYVFTYDQDYLKNKYPVIANAFPLINTSFIFEQSLPPFFDNLVAEGWLEAAQRKLLGRRAATRFELLLAFGQECAGAVSVIDPKPVPLHTENIIKTDQATLALVRHRASLSGVQPKLLLVKEKKHFRLAKQGEISTHIAKLPSHTIDDIIDNEWLTLAAGRSLLPDDDFVETEFSDIPGICDKALVIKRFDRTSTGEKIHFEEFNQLLNLSAIEKYDGAYKAMADFIYQHPLCLQSDVYRLFKRVLMGLLLGNTDMHFKNFAMIHDAAGLRLSPNYDQVAAAIYKPYQYIALSIDNAADRVIGQLKAKTIIALGYEFGLDKTAITMAIDELYERLEATKEVILSANEVHLSLRDRISQFLERRWKGTFNLIGKQLSKKQ